MKNTIELAAEVIRRGMVVDANALLKDECSVEYPEPPQAQYYALFKDSKASIKSREEFRKRSSDYILGFFEGLTARHSYAHPRILGLIDRMMMQACEFLSKDYMTFDAGELPDGVIVNMSVWAFFKPDNHDMWVSNTGRFHTNEELAAILRDYTGGGCL